MIRFCTAVLVSLLISISAFAQQDARGTVTGHVTDLSGANIASADVRVTNVATGVAVSVELTGFRKFNRENVQIRVGETVSVDVQLSVGDVNETVNVTAESPLLQTAEASLGQVVDERRILELPLFSGNAMEFTLLAPG